MHTHTHTPERDGDTLSRASDQGKQCPGRRTARTLHLPSKEKSSTHFTIKHLASLHPKSWRPGVPATIARKAARMGRMVAFIEGAPSMSWSLTVVVVSTSPNVAAEVMTAVADTHQNSAPKMASSRTVAKAVSPDVSSKLCNPEYAAVSSSRVLPMIVM
mmetsp:Transcript_64330/g.139744  ORF Transcript_64330/g.139744 Transcript_64330/m.139744 type:complete len:159 (-) Transcript_64330:1463-1939(-)